MLFNSWPFLLLYLPLTAWVFFKLGAINRQLAAVWLAAASVFFYGYWNPVYVSLLLGSIVFNYVIGLALARRPVGRARTAVLAFGVVSDLAVLGYFKYANFFVLSINQALQTDWSVESVLLPLGISFFTFTQIAFLVDVWAGKAKEGSFIHYVLFVTYFPHLIAGPVLHHKEMMPQFAQASTYRFSWENLAVGSTIFTIGLFKKAVLADGIAPYANTPFQAAVAGETLDFVAAWGGALAYTLQLYFDFSGYSDMAIGLSRIFGVVLPLNFASPYKATNVVDFWRRWHMTLSRFLRDYLYIPLGGNRRGRLRRHLNLLATMVLGGLWHGASWNFVVWGALHGLYLMLNHGWRVLRPRLPGPGGGRIERGLGWLLTFVAVVVAWVFFRAPTLDSAFLMLGAMSGQHGFALPQALQAPLGGVAGELQTWGVRFVLGGGESFIATWGWVSSLLAIALFLPNTQEWMRNWRPAAGVEPRFGARAAWQPTTRWAVAMSALVLLGLLSLTRVSEFLYYQF